jgi:hypothetical protein
VIGSVRACCVAILSSLRGPSQDPGYLSDGTYRLIVAAMRNAPVVPSGH